MPIESLLERTRTRRQLPPPDMRRKLRRRAGLTQRQVAEALGVSDVAVSRWEYGRRTPRGDHLTAYLDLLDGLSDELRS